MNQRSVVCAIDVNDYDQDVIDLAANFALQFGVDLDVVHVSIFPDPTLAAWPAYVGSPNILIADNRRLLGVDTTVAGVSVHHHHLSGIPSTKILGFVEEHSPQLLVLGTHHRKGVTRLLGSVASKILRHAACPVMVFRQRQNSQDFSEPKTETFK